MPNSTNFYKEILLHVIPVRIIVAWSIASADASKNLLINTSLFYIDIICLVQENIFLNDRGPLREKCPNTEFFLVRFFSYSRGVARILKKYLEISWKPLKMMASQLMTSYRKTNITKKQLQNPHGNHCS